MYLNRFIFPAPTSSYTAATLRDNLVYVECPKVPNSVSLPVIPTTTQSTRNSLENNTRTSIKGLGSFKKSTTVLSELDLSKELRKSDPTQNRARFPETSPIRYESIFIEVDNPEKPQSEHNSPRTSLQDLIGKDENEKIDSNKKKQIKSTCFAFFRKQKEKVSDHFKPMQSETTQNRSASKMSASCMPVLQKKSQTVKIPCLYLRAKQETKHTMIFFHSNGEDLFLTSELLLFLSEYLLVNILAVEYPGYGIYKGSPSEKAVLRDAEAAYDYLLNTMNLQEKDILVAGRSLGSGPATHLASTRNPGMLILISPFKSIRAVVRESFGNIAKKLIKERFNNLKNIQNVSCPVFILHGKNDTMICHTHAIELFDIIKTNKKLHLSDHMDHGSFDFFNDLVVPLKTFIDDLEMWKSNPRRLAKHPPSEVLMDI